MHDLMMIGALTGARLDAIVDLTVGDTENGVILFHPRKKEIHGRYVPIHPDLAPVIARAARARLRAIGSSRNGPRSGRRARCASARSRRRTTSRITGGRGGRRGRAGHGEQGQLPQLRRWFVSRMEQAGVEGDLISAIVGHQRGSITLDTYSESTTIARAREAVARVKLPPLDGSPIREIQTVRARRKSA